MLKSKNRYFYHIFVSPGDAPGAITLNVVWMERESDAYKLSRCMCSSKYNRFWDTARYLWKKSAFYHNPLHSTPRKGGSRRNIGIPFGMGKLEWCRYPTVKKFRRYLYSFWRNSRTWRTHRQTDGHRVTAIAALCIASHGKNAIAVSRLESGVRVSDSFHILSCAVICAVVRSGFRDNPGQHSSRHCLYWSRCLRWL